MGMVVSIREEVGSMFLREDGEGHALGTAVVNE